MVNEWLASSPIIPPPGINIFERLSAMDFFDIPAGASHIRVPYKCIEPYDGGDFFNYPARKGWGENELFGGDNFGNRSDAEVEAFFQTWLYFGTLTSVFKLNGIDVDTQEFIATDEQSGELIVKISAALPRRLRDWRMKGNRDFESKAAENTVAMVKKVATFVDRYCCAAGRERAAPTSAVPWPVRSEISLSIIALGFIFSGAIRDLYKSPTFAMKWGASQMLKSKLLSAGWCPMDVRRLFFDVGIDGQYYLAQAKFPHDINLHRRCDERTCHARTVDEAKYVTPHMHPGKPCQENVSTREVVKVIRNEGIPVLSWVKDIDGGGSRFIVDDAGVSELPFVAISHVYVFVLICKPPTSYGFARWSDGLGNPKENALPVCQLERIQSRVDSVFPNGPHPARFWMDTLCIPAAKQYRDLRKQSIALMQEIYKRAFAVLVFDEGLQELSRSSTPHEKAISLYMSNWVHRLWTFQEGMFAKQLYFQLRDGVEDITVDQPPKRPQEEDVSGRFPGSALNAITEHFLVLKTFVELKKLDPSVENSMLLPPLAHALQQRKTTRMSDEAICGATILDLDVREMLGISDPKNDQTDGALADERMEKFLKQIRDFYPQIIFHHQKRLKKEGYRWAPATMMGAQPGDFTRWSNDGSLVAFEGQGLKVQYSGFILETVGAGSHGEIRVMFRYYHQRLRLHIVPEDEDAVVWDPNAVYAVVTAPPGLYGVTEAVVGKLLDPAAVHAEQVKERDSMNVLHLEIVLKCEWQAWTEPLEPELGHTAVMSDALGGTQKWRLV
ncbi:hypothetical protein B0H19DRAFT_1274718 [Mycena capillaripes]|nr:hypothetical protein B0H19DRAFT_1274718 [Mycena capillaripes]